VIDIVELGLLRRIDREGNLTFFDLPADVGRVAGQLLAKKLVHLAPPNRVAPFERLTLTDKGREELAGHEDHIPGQQMSEFTRRGMERQQLDREERKAKLAAEDAKLLDYFAGLALPAVIRQYAGDAMLGLPEGVSTIEGMFALKSYDMAEAMMAERNKRRTVSLEARQGSML